MALLKDRSISLTLEKDFQQKVTGSLIDQSAQELFQSYLPNGLPGAGIKALFPNISPTLVLKGPMYMSFDYSADVGEDNGLFTSFLQPWYIKNVNIQIRGDSYLGATLLSVSDGDVENVLEKFRKCQGDFSDQFGPPGDKQRVILEIKNNPVGARRFIGHFKRFFFSDEIKKASLLDYEINFIGRNIDNMGIAIGKANADAATRVNSGGVLARG